MPNNIVHLEGQKYGEWTVLHLAPRRPEGHNRYWKCRCSCGTEKEIRGNALRKGVSTSCGCKQHLRKIDGKPKQWTGFGEISGIMWARIKAGARIRKIPFRISIEEAWSLFLAQNGRCKLTGAPLQFGNKKKETTASLDRIDSTKSYESGNIQWVHKRLNIMKGTLSQEEFLLICRVVVKHADLSTTTTKTPS
jgi:hypothetical protein